MPNAKAWRATRSSVDSRPEGVITRPRADGEQCLEAIATPADHSVQLVDLPEHPQIKHGDQSRRGTLRSMEVALDAMEAEDSSCEITAPQGEYSDQQPLCTVENLCKGENGRNEKADKSCPRIDLELP